VTEIAHHLVGNRGLPLLAVVENHFSSIFRLMVPIIAVSGKRIFKPR
jgi:hypothetical protein